MRNAKEFALAGQTLGIKEVEDGIWLVSFMHYDPAYIGLEQRTLQRDTPFGPRLLCDMPRSRDSARAFSPFVHKVSASRRRSTIRPAVAERFSLRPEIMKVLPSLMLERWSEAA